jgi:hypothetical protein
VRERVPDIDRDRATMLSAVRGAVNATAIIASPDIVFEGSRA